VGRADAIYKNVKEVSGLPSDCVFCKIANKEMESEIVYEDSDVVAFKDISPAAPVHLLVVPRKHISTHQEVLEEDAYLLGKIHMVINELARAFQIEEDGYRVIVNCGKHSGQVVYHLHFHLLGGKPLTDSLAEGRGA